ncbi:hypothetical protein [uncultured Eubacterium sp.]|uniref:hypothetical protein n=1 Tax=uncultured Eubacterium sp. TaxID=165185 RepID=UPI002600BBDC|nr:hypothetical protein [uncultured Eubacterium sp.]
MPNYDSMHMDYAKYRLERAKDDFDSSKHSGVIASKSDTQEQIENADYVYELLATYINEKVEEK